MFEGWLGWPRGVGSAHRGSANGAAKLPPWAFVSYHHSTLLATTPVRLPYALPGSTSRPFSPLSYRVHPSLHILALPPALVVFPSQARPRTPSAATTGAAGQHGAAQSALSP